MASSADNSSALILVHSIPGGVLAVARYGDGGSSLASWIQQLGNRKTPGSIQTLVAGRPRILFIVAHPLEEPRPEEQWLRANAAVAHEQWIDRIKMIDFRPRNAATF
jgi:hypothetical protein